MRVCGVCDFGVCRGHEEGGAEGVFAVSKVFFYVHFVSQQQLAARVSMTRLSALLSVESEGLG